MAAEMQQNVSDGYSGSRKSGLGSTTGAGKGTTVGFLITEVDAEPTSTAGTPTAGAEVALQTPLSKAGGKGKDVSSALPLISVYRVEDAELPAEVIGDSAMSAPLPATIPMDKVMTNIVQNLDFKAWSENARNMWFKDFKSPPSRAVISDTFWFCICWYFKTGKHEDLESGLFDRISANFVALFSSVPAARKDFFFKKYADSVAQAVLYAMFLAYPKSRVHFTEKFRKDLIIRISYWTTGVCQSLLTPDIGSLISVVVTSCSRRLPKHGIVVLVVLPHA
jgi:hypothetical protein